MTVGSLNAGVSWDPNDPSRLSPEEMESLATETFAKIRQSMTEEQLRVFDEMLDRISMPSMYCECGYDFKQ